MLSKYEVDNINMWQIHFRVRKVGKEMKKKKTG